MRVPVLVIAIVAAGCGGKPTAERTTTPEPEPERPFAMRAYTVVLLKRGPAWSPDETPATVQLAEGHMANIKAMGKSGALVLAGPFDVDASRTEAYAGLFVFESTDAAEVEALLANDPAIAAGRFVAEMYPWYGPAGLTYDGKAASLAAP